MLRLGNVCAFELHLGLLSVGKTEKINGNVL